MRMSALTTSFQDSIGSSSHSNQIRRRNKKHLNCKGGSKAVIVADDMRVYIENPIDSAKNLLDLISEFGKAAGYKVTVQKLMAYFSTNKELSEGETRKKKSHLLW